MRKLTTALVCPATPAANVILEVYSNIGQILNKIFPVLTLTFILTALAVSASAATFTVTNTNDSGSGSLRQAVLDSESAAGTDTINFAINAPATVILTSGALVINQDVTINGSSIHSTTISGNNNSRVIEGGANADITLNYLNITGGKAPTGVGTIHDGGGFFTFGVLVLNNCAVYGNNASQGTGGGIYNGGGLIMLNSTVSGNVSQISGGGIEGDFPSSTALIQDSTIAFNTSGTGGGVHNAQASVQVKNSIIAKNTATNQRPDFSLTMSSLGYNIIGNTSGTNIFGTQLGNQLNVDPLLLPLADNNGPTKTHALQLASTAIDEGDPNRLGLIDQRGSIRGADGDSYDTRGVDIGAYEKQNSAFDFDGDGLADMATTRVPSMSRAGRSPEGISQQLFWNLRVLPNSYTQVPFGLNNDVLAPADYDGDTKTDIAIYRPSNGTWYILGSTQGFYTVRWGIATDIPVPADYDADGKDDPTVYRNGDWHILGSTVGYVVKHVGTAGDTPVPGHYDADSYVDPAVFNAGVWKIDSTFGQGSLITSNFGTAGDIAVPGDYDADGMVNLAVFRLSTGTWYVGDPTGQSFTVTSFGVSTDKPVPADYDGDGKVDVAIFRNGIWWVNNSRLGLSSVAFGFTTDTAVENCYID